MSQVSDGQNVLVQGRIVWVNGDLWKGKKKIDDRTKQPIMDASGNPVIEYGFGLAVPKSALQLAGAGQPGHIWGAIHEEAFKLYPSRQVPPAFGWKYKDGDGVDHSGAPFAQREGYAGHIVFALTTRIPIKFFKFENGVNVQIAEGIKCGDYVNVQVQIKAHGPGQNQSKAGMYLNPYAVQLIGYGKEIVNTPSGDAIFGTNAPALPQGASATPIAPQAGAFAPMPGGPGFAPSAPMVAPAPMGAPASPMGAPQPPAPHYGVLPQQYQPAPMPGPAPAGFAPQPQAAPMGFAAPQQPAPMPAPAPMGFQQTTGMPLPGYPQQ